MRRVQRTCAQNDLTLRTDSHGFAVYRHMNTQCAPPGKFEVFRINAFRVPDFGLRRGEEASWQELVDALPIVRRPRARQERRQPGDFGRGASEILLLGGLHERDDSRSIGPTDLRAETRMTGTTWDSLRTGRAVVSAWISYHDYRCV